MSWVIKLLTSSIGQKIIMSLTGLFLITFLIVHLAGNLQLLADDGGTSFNSYAYFMTHNPFIKTVSYGLYFFIILHAIQGVLIWFKNRQSKGSKSVKKSNSKAGWVSSNMALLGTLILAFLFIHMGDFWFKMKFTDQLLLVPIDGIDVQVKDLYGRVDVAFNQLWIVIVYLVGLLALFFHLKHGFASAFQTLGLNHPKYNGLINGVGLLYSVLVPLGFAIIPLYIYFIK